MNDRLYRVRPDQEVFETGTAQGKQLLLSVNVSEISLHWFATDGEFLELQRIPVEPSPFSTYKPEWEWEARVKRQLAALKERIGFVPGEIAIRKFESEYPAGIYDLPGEYVQFLENPEAYSQEDRKWFEKYIREWRDANSFVLAFDDEYWMTESGEVAHS